MNLRNIKLLVGVFIILAFIAFLSVALLGLSPTMTGMEMNSKGEMSPCPFSSVTAICKMNPLEHISAWQKMFTTTLPQKALAFALLTLVMVSALVVILKQNLLLSFSYYTTRWRLYIKHNPNLFLFNNLREVFSRGILNPKTF